MGVYCRKCRKFVEESRMRYCCYCGKNLRGEVLEKIESSIKVWGRDFNRIGLITGIIFLICLFMTLSVGTQVTGTSRIINKYEENNIDESYYYFDMADGHRVSVDSNTYVDHDVGDTFTYTTTEFQPLYLLIPVIFLIVSIVYVIYSVRKKRLSAISQWEKDGTLPMECR